MLIISYKLRKIVFQVHIGKKQILKKLLIPRFVFIHFPEHIYKILVFLSIYILLLLFLYARCGFYDFYALPTTEPMLLCFQTVTKLRAYSKLSIYFHHNKIISYMYTV